MTNEKTTDGAASALSAGLGHSYWRPEVVAFADAMEARLRANDFKGGWDALTPDWLMARIVQEAGELALSVAGEMGGEAVLYEAADVANFAMMVADVCGELVCSNA